MRRTLHCELCPSRWSKGTTCECPLTSSGLDPAKSFRSPSRASDSLPDSQLEIKKAASEVTRHLCCAAQSDALFAQRLFDQIIRQPRLGIAVSPGVDLPTVLRHACSGRRRRALRDCALSTINLSGTFVILGSIATASHTHPQ